MNKYIRRLNWHRLTGKRIIVGLFCTCCNEFYLFGKRGRRLKWCPLCDIRLIGLTGNEFSKISDWIYKDERKKREKKRNL